MRNLGILPNEDLEQQEQKKQPTFLIKTKIAVHPNNFLKKSFLFYKIYVK